LGILSLSCFEPSLPLSMVSVNKKVEGDDIDMNPDDHVALDESFHPGGGVRPQQDWWNLFLRGAGSGRRVGHAKTPIGVRTRDNCSMGSDPGVSRGRVDLAPSSGGEPLEVDPADPRAYQP
jgi:hypothetical protein